MTRLPPPRSRQARARIALTLCVLWVAGFELLPWAHIALHDHLASHHHDASGAILLGPDPESPIAHAASSVHHDDDDLDPEVDEHGVPIAPVPIVRDDVITVPTHLPTQVIDAQVRLAAALVHGEHSLAHHGIAVPVPAPAVTSPLPIDRRATFVAMVAVIDPISFSPGRAVARGPPMVRTSHVVF